MNRHRLVLSFWIGVLLLGGCGPRTRSVAVDLTRQQWNGRAISYSGYRAGQDPRTQTYPSREQVLEDLRILEKNWRIIRTYGADRHSEDVLEVIRENRLRLSVLLGIWLDGEPGNEAENAVQIENGIRLANAYPDVVVAVNVGNEILVHWSDHRVPEDRVIQYVRRVREEIRQPVTVADDVIYWREHGKALSEVVDFVSMHTYPMWWGQDIDDAMPMTRAHFQSVRDFLPDKTIVISEAGWATYTEGELHAPRAGDEIKQKRYFEELMAWAEQNGVTVFYFEAFDEPWKGTGTEGHWGLFTEGRKAKPAMQDWYPERMPDGPTSPVYGD
ncbi:MAG TPA: glycosyl hydrolase [bacterium]|nr:glycosyl hydrolase [bacterium]